MKTTIQLDDQLAIESQKIAAQSGRTLAAFIEDVLREALTRCPPQENRRPIRLTTVCGQGLRPGVDLDHSASSRDLMESPDAAPRR